MEELRPAFVKHIAIILPIGSTSWLPAATEIISLSPKSNLISVRKEFLTKSRYMIQIEEAQGTKERKKRQQNSEKQYWRPISTPIAVVLGKILFF